MSSSRVPGPSGVSPTPWSSRTSAQAPGVSMTPAERELFLDVTQIVLDVAGIFDPTPASDGTNAVISAARGDWTGAGISAVSIVPFIGDAAKIGRLPRHVETLRRAARAASASPALREALLPVARRIAEAFELARPVLPARIRLAADKALSELERALGRRLAPMRASRHLELIALQLLEFGLKSAGKERRIALYFGIGFPPPIPPSYLTVERLIESAPGGSDFLKYVDHTRADAVVSYRDVEQMWSLLSERVAKAASAQGRVPVFVSPDSFRRMFPGQAVSAEAAEAAFVEGAVHPKSGRLLDEAFNKVESLELHDVEFIAVTDKGKEVARQRHRL